jgi:uncharacterized membrane protein YhfC
MSMVLGNVMKLLLAMLVLQAVPKQSHILLQHLHMQLHARMDISNPLKELVTALRSQMALSLLSTHPLTLIALPLLKLVAL